MEIRLDGQVALVTGAARGLGLRHAERLAEAGATVYLTDFLEDEVIAAAASVPGAHGLSMDVTDDRQVGDVVARIADEQGRLDILVSNAGGVTGMVSPDADPVAAFRQVVALNLVGSFAVCAAVAPVMRAAGGGRIVITSSSTAKRHGQVATSYVSSKAGLIAMTSALARDWGDDGIRVNAVAPGMIAHDGLLQKFTSEQVEATVAPWVAAQAMKRRGTPDDISDAVLFFVSPLSSFVTGQALFVDGGWTFT